MKHTLIAILVLAVSCTQSVQTKPTGNDTSYTVVTYAYNAAADEYRTGHAVRFAIDTIKPDPNDKTRNIATRDTFYNILVIDKAVDSLGAVLKTSAGRDSFLVEWKPANKALVLKDYNYDYRFLLPKQ